MKKTIQNGSAFFTIILFGTAVFSMHFGASCMLWPVTWGQQSGSSILEAALGILLTAIIFPFCAYLAIVRGGGSFYTLISRINEKFAFVFGGITVAVLGPLFVVPRMSAASWDATCKIMNWNSEPMLPALLFAVVYYLITYWFLFKLEDVLSKIGKYLMPFLVLVLIAVVVKSLMNPLSEWMPKLYPERAFSYGFISGYQTMDLPAALIYGTIIIVNLKTLGIRGSGLSKSLLAVGGLGFILLAASNFSQMLVGASTGYLFTDVSYAKLYTTIVLKLWGVIGGIAFNIGLLLAAMTSAIGLASGTAAYFKEASKQKWSYKNAAIVTLVISALVSSFGLVTIIKLTAPILNLIYPPCIALVFSYIFFGNRKIEIIGGATIMAFCWGGVDCLIGYLKMTNINITGIINIYNLVPGVSIGMGWILPAFIGAIIAGFVFRKKLKAEVKV